MKVILSQNCATATCSAVARYVVNNPERGMNCCRRHLTSTVEVFFALGFAPRVSVCEPEDVSHLARTDTEHATTAAKGNADA